MADMKNYLAQWPRGVIRSLSELERGGISKRLIHAAVKQNVIQSVGYPPNGLIVVSGVMGSGKSTFLAAVLRKAIIEKGRQVLTLEEPIEFDFTTIPYEQRSAPICQSGISRHGH